LFRGELGEGKTDDISTGGAEFDVDGCSAISRGPVLIGVAGCVILLVVTAIEDIQTLFGMQEQE